MKLNGFNVSSLCFLIGLGVASAIKRNEIEYELNPKVQIRHPRFIRIYSKGPGEDGEKRTGRKFREHLDNALQGGSIGVEFELKHLKEKFGGLFDTVRRFIPPMRRFDKRSGYVPNISTVDPSEGKDVDFDEDLEPSFDERDPDFGINPRIKPQPESRRFVESEREYEFHPRN